MQALHKLSDRGIVEWAAFAATLAQRLARMLAAGLISPAHQIWNLAVDSILIKAVDADTQAWLSAPDFPCMLTVASLLRPGIP